MLSASDIACIRTSRGTVLIGPLASFGTQAESLVLRYPDEIRGAVDRLFMDSPDGAVLRPFLRRWGLDPNASTRSDRVALPRWLASQVASGLIGIATAPDPILAFAAFVDAQEERQKVVAFAGGKAQPRVTAQASGVAASVGSGSGAGRKTLPETIEERLQIVLTLVADNLLGEKKEYFRSLERAPGLAILGGGLINWIGDRLDPELCVSVLAFDNIALSAAMIRSVEEIARIIGETNRATDPSRLDTLAQELASALLPMLEDQMLGRFLVACRVTRGERERTASTAKPNPKKKETRRIEREPAAREAEKAPPPPVARLVTPPPANPKCAGLATKAAKSDAVKERAQLAEAAYGDNPPPSGWEPATPEDLKRLGLAGPDFDLTRIPGTAFRCDVFKKGDRYIAAFKGTSPKRGSDLVANVRQALGFESSYYSRAIKIAEKMDAVEGDNVEFVGHSLGGGMASAAATAVNGKATTFNAAGVHKNTLENMMYFPEPAAIDAHYVEGDILSSAQQRHTTLMPSALGEPHKLPSADDSALRDPELAPLRDFIRFGGLGFSPMIAMNSAIAVRAVKLHLMSSVLGSLDQQKAAIVREQKKEGCL